jgi:hypothetical protein
MYFPDNYYRAQAYRHLAINPNHLSILGELPPNLTLLLLQHNQDGYCPAHSLTLAEMHTLFLSLSSSTHINTAHSLSLALFARSLSLSFSRSFSLSLRLFLSLTLHTH